MVPLAEGAACCGILPLAEGALWRGIVPLAPEVKAPLTEGEP